MGGHKGDIKGTERESAPPKGVIKKILLVFFFLFDYFVNSGALSLSYFQMREYNIMKVHSHGYREDRCNQCKYDLLEKLGEAVNIQPKAIEKMIMTWLVDNTNLSTRTRQDYQETIKPQLSKMLKVSI